MEKNDSRALELYYPKDRMPRQGLLPFDSLLPWFDYELAGGTWALRAKAGYVMTEIEI